MLSGVTPELRIGNSGSICSYTNIEFELSLKSKSKPLETH